MSDVSPKKPSDRKYQVLAAVVIVGGAALATIPSLSSRDWVGFAAPLVKVRSRTLRHARGGGDDYWSDYLECGHSLDECPEDPMDARLRRPAKRRRCEDCARSLRRPMTRRVGDDIHVAFDRSNLDILAAIMIPRHLGHLQLRAYPDAHESYRHMVALIPAAESPDFRAPAWQWVEVADPNAITDEEISQMICPAKYADRIEIV